MLNRRLFFMLNARHLPVLMYHHVSRCPGLVTLSPETFCEQMKWLADNNWRTVTSAELEYFYQGERFHERVSCSHSMMVILITGSEHGRS